MLYPVFGRCSDTDCNVRRCVFKVINDGKRPLQRLFSQENLDSMEREATPRLLVKLSTQFYLFEPPFSNTVLLFEVFDVDQVRSTVHN